MIRKSTWWTLLAFLVLAAGAYAASRAKQPEETASPAAPTIEPVITFSTEDVVGLEIQSSQKVALEKQGDQWVVITPPPQGNEMPDQGKINTVLYDLSTLRAVNTVPAGTNLKDLGLDTPVYTITVHLKNGKTWQIAVGNLTPIGSGYYIRKGGKILVVDKYAVDALIALLATPPLITPMPTGTPTPSP